MKKKKHPARFSLWPLFLWLVGVMMIALTTHIVAILIMPYSTPRTLETRLAPVAPINQLVVMDQPPLPFEDAAEVMALCRFDLSQRPVRLSGEIPGDLLVILSFQTEWGGNFYGLNDRAAQNGRMDVLIATRAQIDEIESREEDDDVPNDLRLEAPVRGFVLLRALPERASLKGEARQALTRLACTPS